MASVAANFVAECHSATFVVSSVNDSGVGSLRQAMVNANLTNGLDTITFRIPGRNAHRIALLSALPAIVDPVIIDGTTQPGYATGRPVIELNGAGAGSSVGLRLSSSFSVVRGLVINQFGGGGIRINGVGSNTVAGNFIGTDVTGATALANAEEGIYLFGTAGNIVGGTNAADRNVISGNGDAGVYLQNSYANQVLGNYIGVAAGGVAGLGNANHGVLCYESSQNVIGGAARGAPNLISGNGGSGIFLVGSELTNNLIQGNPIGADFTGRLAVANGGDGITVLGAAGNLIGGANAASANLICGNAMAGISFLSGATNNLVQGNRIGVSGLAALGNGLAGVTIADSGGNTVGARPPARATSYRATTNRACF